MNPSHSKLTPEHRERERKKLRFIPIIYYDDYLISLIYYDDYLISSAALLVYTVNA